MKMCLSLLSILLLLAGAVHAQPPPLGYIGLFTDDTHSYSCVTGVGFYYMEMWVWCLPGENGMICAEFDISYPQNVIRSTVNINPEIPQITLIIDPGPPWSLCFYECKWDWIWLFHQSMYVMDLEKSCLEIVPHPEVGVYQFASCEEGYPAEPCIKYSDLYINYDPEECPPYVAVDESSWGAIKGLYR